MKRCIATIHAAEPGAADQQPGDGYVADTGHLDGSGLACQQMALFSDFVKAAGKTLTNQTLAKGAVSISKVDHPWRWWGVERIQSGHGDGNGPVFVYQWSPSKKVLQLKTTAG